MTKALGRQGAVLPAQKIIAELLHVLSEVTHKLPDVAHLVLVTRCVIECNIKIEQQLLASESVPFSFHFFL